ncbi:hypothetical protein RNJ44_04064 [Nakaseomyces bracarensis]|uniref:Peptide hydrolase n=1 Tax=Nakaseomyces bracarensis TaxID=273131 RepID=A0ABR4NU03_9SACH
MLLSKLVVVSLASGGLCWPWGESWWGRNRLGYEADTDEIAELRTIEVGNGQYQQVTESDKLRLRRRGVRFFDVTNVLSFFKSKDEDVVPVYSYPVRLSHEESVNEIIKKIDKESMYRDLSKLTSFYTRYYKSADGLKSAKWVLGRITEITAELDPESYEIEQVAHEGWDQFSMIVRFKGISVPENIIVVGSHHDSINLLLPSILPAPGADDNGSGTITVLESLRLYTNYIHKTGERPKNTVEFHFYSAEEGGLLGSLDIFTRYAQQGKTVVAMLQQDMTGYVRDPEDEHVGIVTDHTAPQLNKFLKIVMDAYLSIPYVDTECGYACSDHGSAMKNGFPAAFVIESEFKKSNRYIHSTMDTLDRLSFDHMAEHAKLVIGTVVELGNWLSF